MAHSYLLAQLQISTIHILASVLIYVPSYMGSGMSTTEVVISQGVIYIKTSCMDIIKVLSQKCPTNETKNIRLSTMVQNM